MVLFKAINYKEDEPKNMTSNFTGKHFCEASFVDLVKTAFSHVSVGDKKKDKDYWISATKSLEVAIEFLQNPKYNFTGIAVINLPNTDKVGKIYDRNLRENGYVDRNIVNNLAVPNWEPNEDGIVTSLDMSSPYTINYLCSVLWLKGEVGTIGNIRTMLNGGKKDEVLLLGENIKFEYFSREEMKQVCRMLSAGEIKEECEDYYEGLYDELIRQAPEGKLRDELMKGRKIWDIHYSEEEDWLKETEKRDIWAEFYTPVENLYHKKNGFNRFINYGKLNYADKDTINFDIYEPIIGHRTVDGKSILDAYLAGTTYMYEKMGNKSCGNISDPSVFEKLYKTDGQFCKLVGSSMGICKDDNESEIGKIKPDPDWAYKIDLESFL